MSTKRKGKGFLSGLTGTRQFTLIELMIVIATIAVILTLALPVYSNYAAQAKIGEALSLGNSAKQAVSEACTEDMTVPSLAHGLTAYGFTAQAGGESFVESIETSGPCTDPVITITTRNTGTFPDPVIILTGEMRINKGHISWRCSSTAPNHLLPATCRS